MTKVIDCSGMGEEVKKELKPIEFTHYLHPNKGFMVSSGQPSIYDTVKYLGTCRIEGDMFSVSNYEYLNILIYKGHYNDGIV